MNPFFEQEWPDAHARLITHLCETLQEHLPEELVARTEEEVVAVGAGGANRAFRPDALIRDPWSQQSDDPALRETASAAEPIRVFTALPSEDAAWVDSVLRENGLR